MAQICEVVSKVKFLLYRKVRKDGYLAMVTERSRSKTQKTQSVNNQIFTFAFFAVKIPF